MIEFRMPSLGADMEAGTLVEWLKKPGDPIKRGDIIAVVDTQKAAIEIEVFDSGVLDGLLVEPGQSVPVGHVIATIRGPEEPASSNPPIPAHPIASQVTSRARPAAPAPAAPGTRPRLTPAARRRTAELSLDLSKVAPGPDGIIGIEQVDSVWRASREPRAAGISFEEMRKAIGAAMVRSNREIPHYYVSSTLNVSQVMSWLESHNAKRPVPERLLYAVPLIRAIAKALSKATELNGRFIDGRFEPAKHVNLGIAIAMRGGGLIAPAIREVESLSMDEIMEKLRDLVARVRGGRLRSSEMSDGTITLSNLGEGTADTVLPLIYPPQTAIIGCGQISDRPWISDGKVVPTKVMTVTVGGDHRVSDGRRAAQFLSHLEQLLQTPEKL